jgi:two-component system invasion response regulator UvrY
MIRVLIADDHAIVRQGLRQILADTHDMEVVAEAADGFETLQRLRETPCDMIVLDISMPKKNGVDVLRQIRQDHPKLPVLILSMFPKDQYAVRLLKGGAAGYLSKESVPEQLVEAIRTVASGRRFIGPETAELLAMEISRDLDHPSHELLSNREFEILRLLASGNTVSEVGDMLNLSVKTVSTYRSRILKKMNLNNNAELTYYAVKNNLVE